MTRVAFNSAVLAFQGSELVKRAINEMISANADEVVLEAEVTNRGALSLYRNLGFLRDKRLLRWLTALYLPNFHSFVLDRQLWRLCTPVLISLSLE
jgi:hypothetical protein